VESKGQAAPPSAEDQRHARRSEAKGRLREESLERHLRRPVEERLRVALGMILRQRTRERSTSP
jgi:hypothetical protein